MRSLTLREPYFVPVRKRVRFSAGSDAGDRVEREKVVLLSKLLEGVDEP